MKLKKSILNSKVFEKLKKKLVELGSQPGAEERAKNFFSYFKGPNKDVSFSEKVEKIYDLFTSGKLSNTDRALVAGALLFMLNPLNLLLDFVPFFGIIDNVVVITLVYRYLANRALEEDNKKEPEDDSH